VGVRGRSPRGTAVWGGSDSGYGVFGLSDSGDGVGGASNTRRGVYGYSESATGILAQTNTGYALETIGRLKLNTSGVATIAAGTTVTLGVDVTAGSFVLLTPAADIGTRRLWFTKDIAANTISVRLSSSSTKATKIS
jgi:hypothetical protein